MSRFRNIWFALAALLWLPAFAHCQLETLTGLEILQCADESRASQEPASHCDNCCAIEKSHSRAEYSRLAIPRPDLISESDALVRLPETSQLSPVPLVLTAAPPDFLQRWHFLTRTTLPARAPSLVS